MTGTGTTVVRRQLGRRLRRLREVAGKSAVDVAEAGIASKAKLSRIENGWTTVKMADVRAMCWLYDADPQTTESLCRMAGGTVTAGWWEEPPESPGADDRLYPGLEAVASRMYCYEPELVPPVLQTREYLQAVSAGWPTAPPARSERDLAELGHRVRTTFERSRPLTLCAVLDATVLGRTVGGAEVMPAQVRRMLQQNRSQHVDIRVIPWSAGAHPGMRGGFTLLEFDTEDDPPVVCLETMVGTRYVERPESVALYRRVFRDLAARAVPLEQYLAAGQAIDLRTAGVTRPDAVPRR